MWGALDSPSCDNPDCAVLDQGMAARSTGHRAALATTACSKRRSGLSARMPYHMRGNPPGEGTRDACGHRVRGWRMERVDERWIRSGALLCRAFFEERTGGLESRLPDCFCISDQLWEWYLSPLQGQCEALSCSVAGSRQSLAQLRASGFVPISVSLLSLDTFILSFEIIACDFGVWCVGLVVGREAPERRRGRPGNARGRVFGPGVGGNLGGMG